MMFVHLRSQVLVEHLLSRFHKTLLAFSIYTIILYPEITLLNTPELKYLVTLL
jgi:hypothetical protein